MTPAGLLTGFRLEEEQWVEAYNVDYGKGTWGTLKVQGLAGLAEGFVSGMSPDHSSVVDLKTGEILLRRQAQGMAQLQPASEGRLLVGIRRGSLIVRARDSPR